LRTRLALLKESWEAKKSSNIKRMKISVKTRQSRIAKSGDLLIADFQYAQQSLATVEGLKSLARQTEEYALNNIASVPTRNGQYVTPYDIPQEKHSPITRASVDAHLQKVQAEQVESYNSNELKVLSEEANKTYLGKRVQILATNNEIKPILVCLKDPYTGAQYLGRSQPKFISGKIKELKLEDNLLIIKPAITKKLLNRYVDYYLVYVINPNNFEPLISMTIS
jgi:hypothetical protein